MTAGARPMAGHRYPMAGHRYPMAGHRYPMALFSASFLFAFE
jgi:hypothetical protein